MASPMEATSGAMMSKVSSEKGCCVSLATAPGASGFTWPGFTRVCLSWFLGFICFVLFFIKIDSAESYLQLWLLYVCLRL